jgi:NAD(P)-dependent dehydrogenase (short-subunit alcohol dehydrogenase family)
VVGIDRTACKTSGPNHHTFVCDIRDLCDEEDSAGDGSAPAAKRGTSAPRALKALLASLAPASSSAAPAGARVHLLVNNAACQARSARLSCSCVCPTSGGALMRRACVPCRFAPLPLRSQQIVAPISETSLEAWSNVISTNLTAPFMLTKLLLPELQASALACLSLERARGCSARCDAVRS